MGHTQAVAEAHYHMVRDEDFAKAAATTANGNGSGVSSESGAKCGALVSQNASQQQAANSGNVYESTPQTKQGPALMPTPASSFHSLPDGSNGRNWTRTNDFCHVTDCVCL